MKRIDYGTPVIAAPWDGGRLPAPEMGLHRWSHREDSGLGVTVCGIRQEDRGNNWVLLSQLRQLAHLDDSPTTTMCPICEELSR